MDVSRVVTMLEVLWHHYCAEHHSISLKTAPIFLERKEADELLAPFGSGHVRHPANTVRQCEMNNDEAAPD